MSKTSKQEQELASDALKFLQEQQKKQEEIENEPLKLCFDDKDMIIPLKKRITPRLIDSITPIISKHTINTLKLFIDQLKDAGVETLEVYSKQFNNELSNEDIENKYNQYVIEQGLIYLNNIEFEETAIYNKEEFELFIKGTNIVQIRADNKLHILLLQKLIDFLSIQQNKMLMDVKAIEKIESDWDSDFWQDQESSEVERIINRFRKKYLKRAR